MKNDAAVSGPHAWTTDQVRADESWMRPLTVGQIEALDLIGELMPEPLPCCTMQLERGDMPLLDDYVMLHSRMPFEHFDEADRRRHLPRLWPAVPISQPLPPAWAGYYGGISSGSVRGSAITPEFVACERRQAAARGMSPKPWKRSAAPAAAAS